MTTPSLATALQQKIDLKTKPVGALGRLEDIALQIGNIQQTVTPAIKNPHIIVFAGDHGIAKSGLVNPYPREVTAQMVLNFLSGDAAINVLCRQNGIILKVVDAGVDHVFEKNDNLIDAKMGSGTQNYLDTIAMTEAECHAAITKGRAVVQEISAAGCNCMGFGEMGIGNSSSAALLMSAITGLPIEDCVGKGTGVNDVQLQVKKDTLKTVFNKHIVFASASPERLLAAFGGFELAMMTGAYLEAAAQKMIIIVDGFISTASLLVAHVMDPFILDYCIFAHSSEEKGHQGMLNHLQVLPLLQLGMRLGEGTGAALAIPLVQAAVNILNEMASFESAGVTPSTGSG